MLNSIHRDIRIIYKTTLGFFSGGMVGRFLGNAASITPLEADMVAAIIASGTSLVSGYHEFISGEPADPTRNPFSYENIRHILTNSHATKIRFTLSAVNFISLRLRGQDLTHLDSMLMTSFLVAVNGFLIAEYLQHFVLPEEPENNRAALQR